MQRIDSFETLVSHLEERDGSYARSSLNAYFFKKAFSGSSFELLCDKDPYSITANDIVAVSMLSVNIPATATRWILGEGQELLHIWLQKIDLEQSISDTNAVLTRGSAPWSLWKELCSLRGIGETKASKLLATKRPFLFPIYDQHVAKALRITPEDYWQRWQSFMRSDDGLKAVHIVNSMAHDLAVPHLSPLRLLDIVIWMQRHGHKFITKKLVEEQKMIRVSYADPT